jgi:hypothetical protein
MDYDFNELDAGLAQLSKEFEGIQTGISNLNNEDPFSEFLNETPPSNSYGHRTNHQKFDPMSLVLEGLDNMTPRGNALDKALEEIDVLIDASNSKSPMSPTSKNSRGRGTANNRPQHSTNDLRKKMSKPQLERGISTMKLEKQRGNTGPSYFTLPEVLDTSGFSASDLQKIIKGLQDETTSMAQQANKELQQYYNQVKMFDEDNAKAFKTIQDLKADLQAQSEDWENSDRKWKAKVEQLEAEKSKLNKLATSAAGGSAAEVERYKSGLRTLNQIKTDLEKRLRQFDLELKKKRQRN